MRARVSESRGERKVGWDEMREEGMTLSVTECDALWSDRIRMGHTHKNAHTHRY